MSADTSTVTLTDFLLARIAEDETRAKCAGHGCGYLHEHNAGWVEVELPDEHNARPAYDLRFIRDNSPARGLAECEAKRLLLTDETFTYGQRTSGEPSIFAHRVMTYLALPYADHPDYRQEWA